MATAGAHAAEVLASQLPKTHRVILIDKQRCVDLRSSTVGSKWESITGKADETVDRLARVHKVTSIVCVPTQQDRSEGVSY